MRLQIGDVTIEADNQADVEFLIDKVNALRGVKASPVVAGESVSVAPVKLEGRIRRTKDELARGLTPEQALNERRGKAGLPPVEAGSVVEDESSEGEKLDGDTISNLSAALESGEFEVD